MHCDDAPYKLMNISPVMWGLMTVVIKSCDETENTLTLKFPPKQIFSICFYIWYCNVTQTEVKLLGAPQNGSISLQTIKVLSEFGFRCTTSVSIPGIKIQKSEIQSNFNLH